MASSPAQADLLIWVGTNGGANCGTAYACSGGGASGNTVLIAGEHYVNGSNNWIWSLTLSGNLNNPPQDLFNINNLNETGTGSLTLFATETDLNYGTAVKFLSTFDTLQATTVDETRTLFIDTTNNGLTSVMLGCVSNAGAIGCQADGSPKITDINKIISGLSGPFSITEEITVCAKVKKTCATGAKGFLQSEDELFVVPEPMTLSLFGSGLLALGAMSRRRRKAAKKG